MSTEEYLKKYLRRVLELISLSLASAAFNAVVFAHDDGVMIASGTVLAVISMILLAFSGHIANYVLEP